jgi:hypothetical protein
MTVNGSLKRIYAAVVPPAVRLRVWRTKHKLPGQLREARWRLLGPGVLKPWVERRLDPRPFSWVFILGCNNSGTTLLYELLAAHPLMRMLPKEGQRITTAIPNSARYRIGRVFSQRLDLFRWTETSDASCVPKLRYDWACQFSGDRGYLVEKSPPNTLRARWLQTHFAPARFIVLVRHPYAVCEGVTRRTQYTIAEAAAHWARVHAILREDMPHLSEHLVVRYEDLCEQPTTVIRQIEQFLELPTPFDSGVVQRSFRSHNAFGTPMTLQNMNANSLKRLSRTDIEVINGFVAEQAAAFGYELLDGD